VPIGQTLNDAKFHRCGPNDAQENRYKFLHTSLFGAEGPPGPKFTSLCGDVQQAPSITLPKFLDSVGGVTHTQTNKKQ